MVTHDTLAPIHEALQHDDCPPDIVEQLSQQINKLTIRMNKTKAVSSFANSRAQSDETGGWMPDDIVT